MDVSKGGPLFLSLALPIALTLFSCGEALTSVPTTKDSLRFVEHFKVNQSSTPVERFVLIIDVSKSLHVTSPRYISLNIDTNQIRKKMRGFDFSSKKLKNMAAAFAPSHIRLGGTYADFLHFGGEVADRYPTPTPVADDDDDGDNKFESGFFEGQFDQQRANFTMSGELWDNLTRFCDDAGWDIMWDFNLFFWTDDGLWDPTDARKFLKYSEARGVKMPSFQLGNEPNAFLHNFNFSIEPDVLVKDFKILRDVVSEMAPYCSSDFYGPEVINLDRHGSARNYLKDFLKSGGCDVVTEIGLHHYYLNGKTATEKDFRDPDVLDTLKKQLDYAYNITWGICRVRKPVRLTETSSCFGGGTPGLSDGFAAGFLWLDKLGLSAKYGVTTIHRQAFYGGSYSLVNYNLNVTPDFWLTLLYKRLIEGPVFHVVDQPSRMLRLYAHCTRKGYYNYPDGALVVYFLNLDTQDVSLSMGRYDNAALHLFMFTAGDGHGMRSRRIKLNGKVLSMDGSKVPTLEPKLHAGDIPVTQQSYGFIVIPGAEVPLCKVYHRSQR